MFTCHKISLYPVSICGVYRQAGRDMFYICW
uniref:Uncharacterized protein n=1 Tax=Populus trichocarpa TaxID=3694 RepID=A0A3N7FHM9_POPTR